MDDPGPEDGAGSGTDTETEVDAAELTPKPKFTDWLADHRAGVLDLDLAEAFADVVDAVGRTGKNGTVTLTLKVSKQGEMFAVVETVAAKIPEVVDPRLYFRDLDGQLTRNDPFRQSFDV